MRRTTFLIGSALTVVTSVVATMFAATLTAQAAPKAADLPRIVTTRSTASSVATPPPSAAESSTAHPAIAVAKPARPARPKPIASHSGTKATHSTTKPKHKPSRSPSAAPSVAKLSTRADSNNRHGSFESDHGNPNPQKDHEVANGHHLRESDHD